MFKKIFFLLLCFSFGFGQELIREQTIGTTDDYPAKIVLVDKNCIDGEYILNPKETFFKQSEFPSIQDLVSSYNENNYMAFIYGVLERRYPTGKSIIEQGGGQQAVDKWLWSTSSASSVLSSLGTVVHEIGHGIDQSNPENWYFISVDADNNPFSFTVPGMHGEMTTSSSPMYSMERSLVLADDQNYKRPPAQSDKIFTSEEFGEGPFGCDKMFAETYLNGDPTNSSFEGGDQGYNMLIEEYVQYINSLACAYYFQDYNRPSSDRHAMLTWMWWNERYLRKIRNEHPDQYEYLFNNTEWLELILTLWGRAWLYLSTNFPGMQPDSDYLQQLVQQQVMLSEIQRVRDSCGCDNPEELLPDQTVIHVDKVSNVTNGNLISHYNYPNPFKSTTTISFTIPARQEVELNVYDITGKCVKVITKGILESGEHTILFNGSDLSSGAYFYKLKTEANGEIVRKIMLIK